MSDPEGLRALYTRVHWLVIADFDRTIARCEKELAEPGEARANAEGADKLLADCLSMLRQRRREYQSDYRHYMQQTDCISLKTMRRFIRKARDLHGEKPEFGFLFAAAALD